MSMDARTHLDRELATSQFKLGDYISGGFDLWKSGYWGFFGFSLLFMLLSMLVGMIPYVGQLVGQLILAPLLTAGAYMYCHHLQRDKNADFETFFSQFTGNAQIFVVYLIYTLILYLCFVPFLLVLGVDIMEVVGASGAEVIASQYEDLNWMAVPLILLPMVVTILLSYALHFVVFYKLSAVEAVTYSFKFCAKHFFPILGFLIVTFLIMASGILGIVIGILFTWHVIWPLSYESFRQFTNLTGFETGDSQQETIDQLIA